MIGSDMEVRAAHEALARVTVRMLAFLLETNDDIADDVPDQLYRELLSLRFALAGDARDVRRQAVAIERYLDGGGGLGGAST